MSKERGISSADSSLKAFVVHTDEELIIARETARLIEDNRKIVNARDARLKRIASKEWNVVESSVFYYETEVQWKKEKEGQIGGPSLPAAIVGAPPEFKGREGLWSPEQLFVASLNTCYMLTFLPITENSKVPVVSFSSTAKGKLEKVAGSNYQIAEIVLKPRVVLASANDLGRMPRILEKAKANCFVSNSIKSAIKVESEIFHQQTQTSPCSLG